MLFIYLFATHHYSRRTTVGICFSSFLILTFTDILKLNLYPESGICYVVVTIGQILVTQFTAIVISATRDSKALFMGLTASNYVIAGSIASIIFHIYTGDAFWSLAGGFLIHLVILLVLYFRIRDIWLKCYEKEDTQNWWGLCLIPVFFYCGFCFLVIFPWSLYDRPENSLGTSMFIITMFASYVAVFRYVESESDRAAVYWKNALFETCIRGMKNQYDLVEQSEKNLKILRHDMRHYSGMIDSLLAEGEYAGIKKITEYISRVTDENRVVKYCENIVVQAILSGFVEKARTCDTQICLDAVIPEEIPVSDYELAAVIANLLENAVDCVRVFPEKEKRSVSAKIRCTDDRLLIEMKNACEDKVTFDAATGLPGSRKGSGHGLGMQSVSAFADKIGGNIGCFHENGVFSIIVFAKFQADLRKNREGCGGN